MKKGVKVVICLSIIIVATFLIFTTVNSNVDIIYNAIVNPENGDVAYCYQPYNSNGVYDMIVVMFSKNGEKLFSKSIYTQTGTHVYLSFYKGILCVRPTRTDTLYCYDRSGLIAGVDIKVKDIDWNDSFAGWESSFGKYSYSLGEYKYQYYAPTIFRHHAELTILNGENINVVYQSYP